MMEAQLVTEFVLRTGANPNDAQSCLNSWGWDLKKALIDYNDTSTTDYFNGRAGLKVSMDLLDQEQQQQYHHQQLQRQKKPALLKSDSIDVAYGKKLYRGISRATENVNLVSKARSEIAMDFHTDCCKKLENIDSVEAPDFTFTLPDISIYSEDFRKFLEKDLIECSTLSALEATQRLNWWADAGFCQKLWPLATTGDGNCLLHAASLAMWGFHDRKLTLRAALHNVLSKGRYRDAIWRRWRFQQTRLNKSAGFVYSEIEWSREWDEIVNMASPEPRNSTSYKCTTATSRRRSVALDRHNSASIDDNATYESLEEIHIFALAHVLQRTIIVIADTVLRDMNGEAMAPIPFGGVYLPFEIASNDCHRAPLLLTYDMAHFSALVSMETASDQPPALIPLIDVENILLPIQFCIDPGADFDWRQYDGNEGNWALSDREHIALLKEYLDIIYASPLGSLDDEIYEDLTDDEYDKRIGDGEIMLNDSDLMPNGVNGKSKAAKQLQSVAKQFGSIGKSVSKKIKKNIGSITKIGSKSNKKESLSPGQSSQSFTRQRILCAQLKAKRHEYQEEMIKNYLECAQDRFLDNERTRELRDFEQEKDNIVKKLDGANESSLFTNEDERRTSCINAGCQSYGTASTSYMCQDCFRKQKQQELGTIVDVPRYGTGNSRFYTQSDMQSHQTIKRLPSVRRLNELDQTLYLSNSTFYNDKIQSADLANRQTATGPSFRHGYSPTIDQHRKSSLPSTISPQSTTTANINDHYKLTDQVDGFQGGHINENDNVVNNAKSAMNRNGLPPGTATIFSPGRTIIHRIIRQDSTDYPTISPIQPCTIVHNNEPVDLGIPLRNTYSAPPLSQPLSSSTLQYSGGGSSVGPIKKFDISQAVATPFVQLQAKPCRTNGCMFYGSSNTNFYCSKCCQMNVVNPQKSQSKILTDV